MPKRQCHHCKEWIERGEPHDCWSTTIEVATADLSEELHEAWDRLHETAAEFGDQRIYASHKSIMFARDQCYFFVRPKHSFLEIVFFLGRDLKAQQVRRSDARSRTKIAHTLHVRHRDEVEPPITDWLQEAYELPAVPRRSRTEAAARARNREPEGSNAVDVEAPVRGAVSGRSIATYPSASAARRSAAPGGFPSSRS